MKNKNESTTEQDNVCHQCKSEHDVGELDIRNGLYGIRAILCKEHREEMIAHFKTLTTRTNAWRGPSGSELFE